MLNETIKRKIVEYFFIVLAGVLYAIALKYFVLPSQVILTGSEGIATGFSYYFDSYLLFIILYMAFQVILITFAYFRVSVTFAIRSSIVVTTVVVLLYLMPQFRFASPESQGERIILVIFGGLLAGVAKAIAFQNRGSTGDEDVLGAYFAMKYLRPVGSIAIIAAVVSTSFGMGMDYLKNGNFEMMINTLMYTSIYIFASAETLNNYYRKFQLTMATIITDDYEKVGKAINQTFAHRTYTVQKGVGGHSGKSLCMVKTIITQEELPELIEVIEEVAPGSFYYHHDIEGISEHYYYTPIG